LKEENDLEVERRAGGKLFHARGPALFGCMGMGRKFSLSVGSGPVDENRLTDGGAEIARRDNAAPYRKGGHRETCFSVRVDAHYKFMFDSGSII